MQRRFSIGSRLLFVVLLTTIPILGQAIPQNCEGKRVAFYNEVAFDSKTGVKRLYEASKVAESGGFIPNASQRSIVEVRSEYERRYKIIVEPVLSDIRQTIAKIANANDIQIFDAVSFDHAGVFLYIDTKLFIDAQLIPLLNLPPDPNRATPTIKVRPLKFAIVNTDSFFDPKTGLRGFELANIDQKNAFCYGSEQCIEVGKFAAKFASETGFDVIFDSARNLPPELRNLTCKDVTSDFIDRFNQNAANSLNWW